MSCSGARKASHRRHDSSKKHKSHEPDTHRRRHWKLPQRWCKYCPVKQAIRGTRFIPFKTPLGSNFFTKHGSNLGDVFETKTLLAYVRKHGEEIGLVIDLTATDRYYDPREWTERGVEYAKIKCMGHTAHGQEENIRRFFDTVTAFLTQNADNSRLIGVHCTHGINRTGYMICRYLVEVEGWDPKIAIQQFELSRGYKIERAQYVTSLYENCQQGCKSFMAVSDRGKTSLPLRAVEATETSGQALVSERTERVSYERQKGMIQLDGVGRCPLTCSGSVGDKPPPDFASGDRVDRNTSNAAFREGPS
uniref:TYR_PHOSPHATASE_2 domain-containing protein n=1 Tax=Ascaris lumbricoides TaxID=6252 RepID=A0A0M3HPQ4_ASCLU